MKPLLTIICTFVLIQCALSQARQDVLCYIEKYKGVALEEMMRCKIPASITLAQGLHESSYGKSKLSCEANNHFGIKCKSDWDGKKFIQNDDAPNECFRVYEHAEDSYADHSDFLITRSRYAVLFQLPITDYKAWAHGLKDAGYATNPKYAEILIKTIQDYDLTEFDKLGLAMIEQHEKLMDPNNTEARQPLLASTEQPVKNTVTTAPLSTTKKERAEKQTANAKVFAPAASAANQKEYSVNGCKVIKAQGGVDPLTVAFNYQMQYAQVLAFNDLNDGEHFKDGENIFLQSKKARGAEANYVAQPGESMHDISQKTGVKLKDLYQKNLMVLNDQPVAGESIALQEKRSAAPRTMAYSEFLKSLAANTAKPSSTETTTTNNNLIKKSDVQQGTQQYTVGPSDTLYSIAKRFNTSVQQICALNNLQSPDLQPGQTLVIGK